jgi:segregation and condensation protein A
MDLGIASHQARAYLVATPVFEGPLDLLLQLIERAELDITRLALAQVTDQYLAHLHTLPEQAAEEVSAFLVIASKLIQIKSEALLPRPPARAEGEEDPGEALARQLLLYKKFKTAAIFLSEREARGLRTYLRLAPPPKIEGVLDLSGLTVADLCAAAETILRQLDDRSPLGSVVAAPRVTIREKITVIARQLREHGRTNFRSLLGAQPSHLDVVVTFLALLELIKRRLVAVQQDSLFGEIDLEPVGAWDENESFELEFGE